jgi:hypothetical protein
MRGSLASESAEHRLIGSGFFYARRTCLTVADASRSSKKSMWFEEIVVAATKKDCMRMHEYLNIRGRAIVGNTMFRSAKVRFAVIALFAVAAVSLTAASAGAFSQGNGGIGEGSNSTFADPDDQINIFGQKGEAQAFGSNGPVQFDPQRGQLTPFKHFQSNGLTSPPDPLTRPSN